MLHWHLKLGFQRQMLTEGSEHACVGGHLRQQRWQVGSEAVRDRRLEATHQDWPPRVGRGQSFLGPGVGSAEHA